MDAASLLLKSGAPSIGLLQSVGLADTGRKRTGAWVVEGQDVEMGLKGNYDLGRLRPCAGPSSRTGRSGLPMRESDQQSLGAEVKIARNDPCVSDQPIHAHEAPDNHGVGDNDE